MTEYVHLWDALEMVLNIIYFMHNDDHQSMAYIVKNWKQLVEELFGNL